MVNLLLDSMGIIFGFVLIFAPPSVALVCLLCRVLDGYLSETKIRVVDGIFSCVSAWVWMVFFVSVIIEKMDNQILTQFTITMTILTTLNFIGAERMGRWHTLLKKKREERVINKIHMNKVKHKTILEKEHRF